MKHLRQVILSGVAVMLLASAAVAQQADAFMIIRFNQPRMYFDQQLYNAVSKAVSIKEDVMFELISYAPATGDAAADDQWKRTAGHNLGVVVARLNSMGVPSSRMMTSVQPKQGIKYDEVHLFAY